jgi:hypothetical protein
MLPDHPRIKTLEALLLPSDGSDEEDDGISQENHPPAGMRIAPTDEIVFASDAVRYIRSTRWKSGEGSRDACKTLKTWPDGAPFGRGHGSAYLQPIWAAHIATGQKVVEGRPYDGVLQLPRARIDTPASPLTPSFLPPFLTVGLQSQQGRLHHIQGQRGQRSRALRARDRCEAFCYLWRDAGALWTSARTTRHWLSSRGGRALSRLPEPRRSQL